MMDLCDQSKSELGPLSDAGAPDAGAPDADAVHLSGNDETDVPPGVGRRPLPPFGESDDDEVPRPLSATGESDDADPISDNLTDDAESNSSFRPLPATSESDDDAAPHASYDQSHDVPE